MSDVIVFSQAEIATPADFTAISESARQGFDAVAAGSLGWPAHWARITVAQTSPDVVTLTPGEYYEGDAIYASKGAIEVNLQTFKPVISTDERWVALILRGSEETINASRAFETSEEPLTVSVPVSQATPKTIARRISVIVQLGEIAPPPALRPAIAQTDCCVAFVRLTTSGIQEVVSNASDRVKTVYEIDGRLTIVEVEVNKLRQDTNTISTDVANLAAAIKAAPSRALVAQLARDVSMTRQRLQFPEEARNYFFDQGLVRDAFWDAAHANSVYRIREGVRFQYVAQFQQLLRALNPSSPEVSVYDNTILMPAYEEVTRIESPVGNVRKDISNVVHTITTATQHTVSHEAIRFGETITPCENTAGWENLGNVRAGEMFQANGETWVSQGVTNHPWNQTATAQNGHLQFAVQRVIRDTWTETFTTYHTEEFGLNGAIMGQTFLNAQVMVLTSIEVYFTRVGTTGDVVLCLCRVGASGAPDFDAVIAKVTKPRNSLAVNAWNKFALPPTLLEQGKRYAWFTVTSGNHQLAGNSGNQFTGGTMFVSTDGAWAQGDLREDFAFRINAARFLRSRTVVPFEPITLDGGMTELEMIFKAWEPAGTSLVWEVRPQGAADWVPMDDRNPNPLATLPPLVQLRAVFNGTTDVAPGIVLDNWARCTSGRMRSDMTAVSKSLQLGFSTDTFQIVMNVDSYDPLLHTFTPRLIAGGSTVSAAAVIVEEDPMRPSRSRIIANFTLASPVSSFRARIEATSTSIVKVPFIQDFQINCF